MPGDFFAPDNKFGIVSSDTVLTEEIENFLNDGEPEPIKKGAPKEEPQPPKKDDKKLTPAADQEFEQPIKPKVLGEKDLLGEEDEEEEQDNDVDEEDDVEEKTEEKSSSTVFSDISEDLYNLGVFTEDEEGVREPIVTPEQFRDRFFLESGKRANEALEKFLGEKGPEASEIFEAIFVNGIDPRTYLEKYTAIRDVENLDLADELNQEKVVRELYRRNGMKNIDARIEKLKSYGDLAEEATDAKDTLISQDKQSLEQEKEEAKQKELKKAQIRQDYINGVSRILNDKLGKKDFDGIPVDKKFADDVANYLLKEAYETPQKQRLTAFDKDVLDLNKPENYELKVKVAMLMKVVKEDPTLSRIQKGAVSKQSNELFRKVAQRDVRASGSKEIKKDNNKRPSFFS